MHACGIIDLNVHNRRFIYILANGISVTKYKGMVDCSRPFSFSFFLHAVMLIGGKQFKTPCKFIPSEPSILFVSIDTQKQ